MTVYFITVEGDPQASGYYDRALWIETKEKLRNAKRKFRAGFYMSNKEDYNIQKLYPKKRMY